MSLLNTCADALQLTVDSTGLQGLFTLSGNTGDSQAPGNTASKPTAQIVMAVSNLPQVQSFSIKRIKVNAERV